MDEISNSQQLEKLIKKQIESNLSTSVLKNGEWGSYWNLSIETNQKYGIENFTRAQLLLISRYVIKQNGRMRMIDESANWPTTAHSHTYATAVSLT